jgi:hypothetical protein
LLSAGLPHRLPRDPLLTLIPRNLFQELIQDLGGEPKHAIDASVDEPLAEHLPCPNHFAFDLLAFLAPLLIPLKSFFELLQILLPLVGTPVLRDGLVNTIQRNFDFEYALAHKSAFVASQLEVFCLRPVSYFWVVRVEQQGETPRAPLTGKKLRK